ncbi:MAG: sulfur carrier protein ThiS [Gammaproteobacteria bacterium]
MSKVRINIKTGGLLGKYLPPGGKRNQAELEVSEGATPVDVIRKLGMPDTNYLVALNGEVVPVSERAERKLSENDQLSIMPPLRGG